MPHFSVQSLKPQNAVKFVFDGNSQVQSVRAKSTPLPTAFGNLRQGTATGVTNLGGSGRTSRMMNGLDGRSAARVGGAFDATTICVLFA